MQTALADFVRDTPQGREANEILRSCVHCGFCLPRVPDLPAARRRARQPARAHLPDQAAARGRAGQRPHPAAPRPLSHLPCLRERLPIGRAVRPPARHRPGAVRAAPATHAAGAPHPLPAAQGGAAHRGACARCWGWRARCAVCCPRALRARLPAAARAAARGPKARRPHWPAPRHARRVRAPGGLRAAGARGRHQLRRRRSCSTASASRRCAPAPAAAAACSTIT